jgi:hypothetical protein
MHLPEFPGKAALLCTMCPLPVDHHQDQLWQQQSITSMSSELQWWLCARLVTAAIVIMPSRVQCSIPASWDPLHEQGSLFVTWHSSMSICVRTGYLIMQHSVKGRGSDSTASTDFLDTDLCSDSTTSTTTTDFLDTDLCSDCTAITATTDFLDTDLCTGSTATTDFLDTDL